VPEPIARWNPARDVWESGTTGLFCEHSDVFSGTWPISGMTRSGVAYPLPPWDAHTTGGESSSPPAHVPTPLRSDAGPRGGTTGFGLRDWSREISRPDPMPLLGTPRCSDGITNPLRENVGDPRGRLEDQVALLPTPRATDGSKGGPNQRGSSGDLMLPSVAASLVPTPTARDWKGQNQRGDATYLPGALLPTPTAADGERTSATMPRGNPTLLGSVSTGGSTPPRSGSTS
jgi:hypothetical protein